jgi:hypothetical protein
MDTATIILSPGFSSDTQEVVNVAIIVDTSIVSANEMIFGQVAFPTFCHLLVATTKSHYP